ncbi:MAG: TetR/AcrR family transcriptional regulator [Rhodospirillaceae bacterium]|nr:TetR/AcrR family transcriptional regulator [Rhodospirillaceae bacterium]
MTATNRAAGRRRAVSEVKRKLILDAARRVFEVEGLEGASLRAIAAEAGYTPAALYFHFPSKEAIYGEVLRESLDRLRQAVADAVGREATPAARLKAAAMAFFGFYAVHPRDLDLGFYLLRGGMQPRGLGRELDEQLNLALGQALLPIAEAAEALGASPEEARSVLVDAFAHAAGLLMLAHTGRIRMFAVSAQQQMDRYVDGQIADLMQA